MQNLKKKPSDRIQAQKPDLQPTILTATKPSPAAKPLPVVRKIDFNLRDDIPLHWFNNDPMMTHYMNALHLVFPDGERFFIKSVQYFGDRIKDENLKERVKAFIGQEVQHGKGHESFWETLREQGFDLDVFLRFFHKTAINGIVPWGTKLFGPEMALSVTVALEHYTAVLADNAFENRNLYEFMPEAMADFMYWHSAEEIEHKSVAFDVLQEVDGSYVRRAAGMVLSSWALFFYAFCGQAIFLTQDKTVKLTDMPGHLFRFARLFMQTQGGVIARNLLQYFKPDFHPDDSPVPEKMIEFMQKLAKQAS